MQPIFVYAKLNARVMPLTRGDLYEDPLQDALADSGLGEVTGGGTMQTEDGEIEYCGVDVDLIDSAQGVPFICEVLNQCGAPKGSKVQFEQDGQSIEVPFGVREGLAIYLNGTDLPDEVYATTSADEVIENIERLLGDQGRVEGHWQGPTETALYLYGASADTMRALISGFIAEYPGCQLARVVQIA